MSLSFQKMTTGFMAALFVLISSAAFGSDPMDNEELVVIALSSEEYRKYKEDHLKEAKLLRVEMPSSAIKLSVIMHYFKPNQEESNCTVTVTLGENDSTPESVRVQAITHQCYTFLAPY